MRPTWARGAGSAGRTVKAFRERLSTAFQIPMPFTDTCQGVGYWSDDLPSQTRLFVCHDYKALERDHYAWETTVEDERLRNVHVPGGERRRVRGHSSSGPLFSASLATYCSTWASGLIQNIGRMRPLRRYVSGRAMSSCCQNKSAPLEPKQTPQGDLPPPAVPTELRKPEVARLIDLRGG